MNQKSSWAVIVLCKWKPILLNSRKGKRVLVKDSAICISRNKFTDWETLSFLWCWITPVQWSKHFSSELSASPATCNIVCAGLRTAHFSCPSAGALLCLGQEEFCSVQELLHSGIGQQLGIWQLPLWGCLRSWLTAVRETMNTVIKLPFRTGVPFWSWLGDNSRPG